jgi:hypothetical protein
MSDRVIIRQWKLATGLTGIEAVLPDNECNPGNVCFYQHVGQHSEGSLEYYRTTKPADTTTPEAQALIAELKSIGYDVKLCKRLNRPHSGWAK